MPKIEKNELNLVSILQMLLVSWYRKKHVTTIKYTITQSIFELLCAGFCSFKNEPKETEAYSHVVSSLARRVASELIFTSMFHVSKEKQSIVGKYLTGPQSKFESEEEGGQTLVWN